MRKHLISVALLAGVLLAHVTAKVTRAEDWPSAFAQWRGFMIITLQDRTIPLITHDRFDTEHTCVAFLHSAIVIGSIELLLADAQAEDVTATVSTYCSQGEPI